MCSLLFMEWLESKEEGCELTGVMVRRSWHVGAVLLLSGGLLSFCACSFRSFVLMIWTWFMAAYQSLLFQRVQAGSAW